MSDARPAQSVRHYNLLICAGASRQGRKACSRYGSYIVHQRDNPIESNLNLVLVDVTVKWLARWLSEQVVEPTPR